MNTERIGSLFKMQVTLLTSFVLLLATLNGIIGAVFPTEEELRQAASLGDWETFGELIRRSAMQDFLQKHDFLKSQGSIRDLKPLQGGHVYGEAEYSFQSSSNVDGQTKKVAKGHKIVNANGTLTEYDFEPKK